MSTTLRRKSTASAKPPLFSVHDPPAVEAAEKKKALDSARKAQHKKRAGSKSSSLLNPKEIASRTFFIPEQTQNDPPALKSNIQPSSISPERRSKTKPAIPQQTQVSRTNNNLQSKTTLKNNSANLEKTLPTSRHGQSAMKSSPFTSQGVVKQTISLRTRPKSATAARHHNPEAGTWHVGTDCEDWNMLTLNTDAQRWANLPQRETEKVDHPLKSAHTLSHRKPSVPGQVCYGTNNKGVALPRRPITASEGRENRPSVKVLLGKPKQELGRHDFGGWEASTQLDDERTNFDGRYRYPQKYAEGDIARVAEYRIKPPPVARAASKAAWIHTSSSCNSGIV